MKNISEKVRRVLYHMNFVREFAEAIVERKKSEEKFDGDFAEKFQLGGVGLFTSENIILLEDGLDGSDDATNIYEIAKSRFDFDLGTSVRQLVTYLHYVDAEYGVIPKKKIPNTVTEVIDGKEYTFRVIEERYFGLENVESSCSVGFCSCIAEKQVLRPLYFPREEEFKKPVYKNQSLKDNNIVKPPKLKNKNMFNRIMDNISQVTGW